MSFQVFITIKKIRKLDKNIENNLFSKIIEPMTCHLICMRKTDFILSNNSNSYHFLKKKDRRFQYKGIKSFRSH